MNSFQQDRHIRISAGYRAAAPSVVECLQSLLGGSRGRGGVDRFEIAPQGVPVLPRDVAKAVADQVDLIPT